MTLLRGHPIPPAEVVAMSLLGAISSMTDFPIYVQLIAVYGASALGGVLAAIRRRVLHGELRSPGFAGTAAWMLLPPVVAKLMIGRLGIRGLVLGAVVGTVVLLGWWVSYWVHGCLCRQSSQNNPSA